MGGGMGRHCKKVLLQLDDELAAWLESKAAEGYKKASLIRSILHREMDMESDPAAAAEGGEQAGDEEWVKAAEDEAAEDDEDEEEDEEVNPPFGLVHH
jgi:hypothetical protein